MENMRSGQDSDATESPPASEHGNNRTWPTLGLEPGEAPQDTTTRPRTAQTAPTREAYPSFTANYTGKPAMNLDEYTRSSTSSTPEEALVGIKAALPSAPLTSNPHLATGESTVRTRNEAEWHSYPPRANERGALLEDQTYEDDNDLTEFEKDNGEEENQEDNDEDNHNDNNHGNNIGPATHAPTWNNVKYLPGFLEPWQNIPGTLDLRQICRNFPNHLHGEHLDAFIQHKWSDADIIKELAPGTYQRYIDVGICKTPKNMMMRRLMARWVQLGPAGLQALDNSPKRYPAHKSGNSRQEVVRDPAKWAAYQAREAARRR